MVIKVWRSDKLVPAIQNFIADKIGKKFIEPPTFNIGNC